MPETRPTVSTYNLDGLVTAPLCDRHARDYCGALGSHNRINTSPGACAVCAMESGSQADGVNCDGPGDPS